MRDQHDITNVNDLHFTTVFKMCSSCMCTCCDVTCVAQMSYSLLHVDMVVYSDGTFWYNFVRLTHDLVITCALHFVECPHSESETIRNRQRHKIECNIFQTCLIILLTAVPLKLLEKCSHEILWLNSDGILAVPACVDVAIAHALHICSIISHTDCLFWWNILVVVLPLLGLWPTSSY